MGINNFTINLACRLDRTDNKNEAPLYLTINQGKQRKKISLDCKLNVSYWDNQAKAITTECINKEYYELIIANKKQEINKKIITANIEGRELFLDDFADNKKKSNCNR